MVLFFWFLSSKLSSTFSVLDPKFYWSIFYCNPSSLQRTAPGTQRAPQWSQGSEERSWLRSGQDGEGGVAEAVETIGGEPPPGDGAIIQPH